MPKKKAFSRRLLIVIIPVILGLSLIGLFLASSLSTAPPPDKVDVIGSNGNSNNGSSVNPSTDHGGGSGGMPVNTVDTTSNKIIGFPIDVADNVGMVSTLLKDDNDKLSMKFTAKYSGDVNTVVINLLTTGGYSSNISGGLQDDYNGVPSGNWIGQPGLGSGTVDENGFMEIALHEPAKLVQGKVYHIVIQATDPAMSSGVRVRMYHFNSLVQPLNDVNLDKPLQDPMMNTLIFDSTTKQWSELDNWPIYVIKYSDGKSEGQPYSLSAPWVIYGPRYVGQEFVPSSNYIVEDFGFSVSLSGIPNDKLYYEVRDASNKVLAKGLFAEAGQIEQPRTFIKVKLDSPISLKKDEIYRFVLLSPGTDLKKPYQLYGHEFTYDNKIGYGGLRQLLTISYDSGSTWLRWEDADSIFDITTK